jgi:hypothetical protein
MTVFSFSLTVGAPSWNFSFPVVAIVVYTPSMHDRSVVFSMNRTPSSDHSSSRLRDERNTHITGIQSCRLEPRKMQRPPFDHHSKQLASSTPTDRWYATVYNYISMYHHAYTRSKNEYMHEITLPQRIFWNRKCPKPSTKAIPTVTVRDQPSEQKGRWSFKVKLERNTPLFIMH